jgi:hypothetical protein
MTKREFFELLEKYNDEGELFFEFDNGKKWIDLEATSVEETVGSDSITINFKEII